MFGIDEAERRKFTKKLSTVLANTDSVPELINQTNSVMYESEAFITSSKP